MVHFEVSAELGRIFRADPLDELGVSTYSLLRRAVEAGEWSEAGNLAAYFRHEVSTVSHVFADWLRDCFDYLERRDGPGTGERIGAESALPWYPQLYAALFGHQPGEMFRLLRTREFANEYDGRYYQLLADAIAGHQITEALEQSGRYLAAHQTLQALYADWTWGLMTDVARIYGEDEIAAMVYTAAVPWFRQRYDRYFAMAPEERLKLQVEWMRGHLCGPARAGDVEVADEGDRWILAFDPCGSGGAMRRGNVATGEPPRTEAPFNFGSTSHAHDWSWSQAGVCYYCAHCAIINEQLAIDVYGFPLRVTEYPQAASDKCRWTIYKDSAAVPDEAYERVGRRKGQGSRG